MEEKIDETELVVNVSLSELKRSDSKPCKPSSKGQFIYQRELAPAREINVYDAKNVYRSQSEIDRDIMRGQFKIEKTFTTDLNGNLFFLCYDHQLKET